MQKLPYCKNLNAFTKYFQDDSRDSECFSPDFPSLLFTYGNSLGFSATFRAKGVNSGSEGWFSVDELWPNGMLTADSFTMTLLSESTEPLVEGDVLEWSNADQKFKPAQLPEVINKATLKAEVAASTDFADFQSRIAAL